MPLSEATSASLIPTASAKATTHHAAAAAGLWCQCRNTEIEWRQSLACLCVTSVQQVQAGSGHGSRFPTKLNLQSDTASLIRHASLSTTPRSKMARMRMHDRAYHPAWRWQLSGIPQQTLRGHLQGPPWPRSRPGRRPPKTRKQDEGDP